MELGSAPVKNSCQTADNVIGIVEIEMQRQRWGITRWGRNNAKREGRYDVRIDLVLPSVRIQGKNLWAALDGAQHSTRGLASGARGFGKPLLGHVVGTSIFNDADGRRANRTVKLPLPTGPPGHDLPLNFLINPHYRVQYI
jgi:hypothetical protein